MLLTNGRIHSFDPAYAGASTLLVRDETVLAVGAEEDIVPLARPGEQRIDLQGRMVVPSFVDAHLHLHWYAQMRQWVDLQGVTSLDEVLRRVAERVAQTAPGEWIVGRGWNQNLWSNPVFPTAADLDRVAPHHPVCLIAQSGHAGWLNSQGLAAAAITPDRPDPAGGQIQRDIAGQPTGLLFEEAMDIAAKTIGEPTPAEAAEALRQALPDFWDVGITGVHCMDGWIAYQALDHLHQAGQLDLRVVKYLPLDHLDEAIASGLRSGLGDDWLRIGGLKLFADGALGVRSAALMAPYENEPDNLGMFTLSREALTEIGQRASAAGLGLAVHAIGDAANRMVLEVLAGLPQVAGFPHRLEHAQLLHPDDFGFLVAHDITASMQPIHATSDMEMATQYWGDRTRYAYAWRSVLAHGTRLAFGSDCPVESFDPLLGLHAAVTRRRTDGSPGPDGWHPEQRLTVSQALAAYTLGPAQAINMAHKMGTLSPGRLADLVVLDRDIFEIDPMEIADVRVLGTMIGGRWVKPLVF